MLSASSETVSWALWRVLTCRQHWRGRVFREYSRKQKGGDFPPAQGIIYIPGKAANAGGVGVSGFEMSQNSQHMTWTAEEVDNKLNSMMTNIFNQMQAAVDHIEDKDGKEAAFGGTLEEGANQAGFLKVANAMKELGWMH